ncbi:MAG TPA: YdeI/OmpD-associated family protein [Devosiaceae bacterium]|nr:YdeI/OmpD-associated family protein [Devosiaceae bacterium]
MKASELTIDADVDKALKGNPSALRAFSALPPSHRREYLDWFAEARRPETRRKRIAGLTGRIGGTGADGQA